MEEDDNRLIERLSNLLHEICDALKGKPPLVSCTRGMTCQSWHKPTGRRYRTLCRSSGRSQPTSEECQGCNMEIDMALSELKKVGIEYQRRKITSP
jgi:hypothetical protein